MQGEVLTRAEVTALLKACNPRYPTGLRNRALLAVAYRSGLRSFELVALRPTDVDVMHAEIRVRRGKGQKSRTVPVDVETIATVGQWTRKRAELAVTRIDPLFCTLRGGEMSTRYLRDLLPRLAKRAELGRRVHPHAFRHTYAVELVRDGLPLIQIQVLLGHSNLDTTAKYIAKLTSAPEIRAAIRARPSWTT